MATYDKTKCVEVGKRLVDLVEAVTDAGVTMDDMDEFLALVMALKDAQPMLATDTDASILHIISGATDAFGDKRVNPPATV